MAYVQRLAEQLGWGSRLPPIAHMARESGVAPLTMWRAVQALASEAVVDIRGPRNGTWVGKARREAREQPVDSSEPVPRWLSVRRRLLDDLIHGVFPPQHSLPSRKELCHRYGTCGRVLRRALESLAADTYLVPHKRSYRPSAPGVSEKSSCIAVIVSPNITVLFNEVTPLWQDFWRMLEAHCLRRNLRLIVCNADSAQGVGPGPLLGNESLLAYARRNPLLGCIVPTLGYHLADIDPFLRYLQRLRCPIAVVDSVADDVVPQWVYDDERYCCLRISATQACGRDVGNHLISLGHRRIAFLNPFEPAHWVLLRDRGLESAMVDAGLGDGLARCGLDSPMSIRLAWSAAIESASYREFLSQARSFEQWLHDDSGGVFRPPVCRRITPTLRQYVNNLRALPLFERALADPNITAWVAVSDAMALAAMDFLAKRRVPVPRRLSVVGFDDTYEALTSGLTSYNFNVPRLIHAMLEFVLRRERPSPPGGVYEIPGHVVARRTAASPL